MASEIHGIAAFPTVSADPAKVCGQGWVGFHNYLFQLEEQSVALGPPVWIKLDGFAYVTAFEVLAGSIMKRMNCQISSKAPYWEGQAILPFRVLNSCMQNGHGFHNLTGKDPGGPYSQDVKLVCGSESRLVGSVPLLW